MKHLSLYFFFLCLYSFKVLDSLSGLPSRMCIGLRHLRQCEAPGEKQQARRRAVNGRNLELRVAIGKRLSGP